MTRHGEDDPPQAPPPGVRAQDGYGRGVSPFQPAARRPLLRRLVPVSKRLPGYGGGGPLVVVAAAIVASAALDLAAGIGQGFPSSTCPRRSWGRSSWPPGSAS